jgi:hypothetical protein
MAAQFGVEVFCLTDHDTYAGFDATADALQGEPCHVMRGLELSCRAFGRTVHMLMYRLTSGAGLDALEIRLERIGEQRKARLRRICERLAELGVELDADAILQRSHGSTPGRPDVARALVDAGVCSSPREAFTRFLHDGGPADVPVDRLTVAEGLALGTAAGAKMSLAHPHTLGEFALVRELFVEHRDQGLEGIEAYYGKYQRAQSEGWLRLARQFDLVPTGGSDYHGDMAPEVLRPGIELPSKVSRLLMQWLELA